jgi:hypothetical protein
MAHMVKHDAIHLAQVARLVSGEEQELHQAQSV